MADVSRGRFQFLEAVEITDEFGGHLDLIPPDARVLRGTFKTPKGPVASVVVVTNLFEKEVGKEQALCLAKKSARRAALEKYAELVSAG